MPTIRVITASTVEPVSVETVRAFLRVDGDQDDTLIASLIKAAREEWERIARRACITQTLEQVVDCFPEDYRLQVLRPPLQSVESVKYVDRDGVEHTWTDYQVDTASDPGVILFKTLPGAALLESGAVRVRFTTGYGDAASDVPERVRTDITQLAAFWFEERLSGEVPMHLQLRFRSERTVWF